MPKRKTEAPSQTTVSTDKPKPVMYQAVGRRKSAIARVRLFPGDGQLVVNGKPIEQYFSSRVAQAMYSLPFKLVEAQGKFDGSIKLVGSGASGQLGALVHGVARALLQANPQWRTVLKRQGLLTRDARVREQRKYGYAQKARKRKQSPKR